MVIDGAPVVVLLLLVRNAEVTVAVSSVSMDLFAGEIVSLVRICKGVCDDVSSDDRALLLMLLLMSMLVLGKMECPTGRTQCRREDNTGVVVSGCTGAVQR